jgi:hypothetical protein
MAWIGPPSEMLIDPLRYATSPKAAETASNLLRGTYFAEPDLFAASPCIAELTARQAKAPLYQRPY